MSDSVITVSDFRKEYGDFVAVDGIDFDVQQRYLDCWPQRRGKTSTLECLEGLRLPDGDHCGRRGRPNQGAA